MSAHMAPPDQTLTPSYSLSLDNLGIIPLYENSIRPSTFLSLMDGLVLFLLSISM